MRPTNESAVDNAPAVLILGVKHCSFVFRVASFNLTNYNYEFIFVPITPLNNITKLSAAPVLLTKSCSTHQKKCNPGTQYVKIHDDHSTNVNRTPASDNVALTYMVKKKLNTTKVN